VLAFSGEGTAQSVADGIYWAADNGAQVINMSLGWPSGYDPGPVVHDAIEYAYEQGAVLVASSGNGGSSPVAYPAAYPEVIAVGATRYDDGRVIYSQYGSALEVVAPGGDVFADQNGDSYPDGIVQNTFAGYYPGRLANPNDFAFYCYEGTSMAAPHVSGLVAMMIANGQTGIENIRNILHETAIDLGEPGWDPYYGYGRIDALGALTHTDTSLTARFTGDPVEGSAPLAVDFADHSTGTVTSWEWDFGDGSAYSSEQHASHEYADPGEYTVTLTVYGPAGSDSEIKTDYIQVDGDLIAAFSATPTQGYAPLGVSFSDESVGEVTSWEWDFGDGSPHSSEERPSHQYAAAGSYTVTLTVVGPEGTDSEAKADYIRVTAPGLAIIGEVGSVIQDQPGANTWHTVSLRNAYTSPVVIAKSLSSNSSEPAHVRIRQVTSSSFQWQIEEWEYQDGSHSSETMNYVVVEAGSHRLEDGTRLAAGVEAVDDSWAMVSFDRVFGSRPALLVSTMTTGDPCACVPRTQGLERDRFEIRVQEEEAQDQAHGTEIVGWLAVEPRTGANNGNKYHAGRTGNVVKHGGYTLSLTGFSSPPIFLCHDDTYNGANVCAVRWRNLTAASVEVVAEEETSYDPEINHTGEAVSFLAWAAPGDLVSDGEWTERNLDCRSHRSVDDGPSDMCVRPPVLTCSPNPFTQSTTLSISVAAATSVETVVYDTCGRRVRALAHGRLPSGTHMLAWDGTDEAGKRVTSGVYFFKVVTGSEIVTRKVIMLR
jgi:PKD repeat protein